MEQEIKLKTINKYLSSINMLSISTGKLDTILSYCNKEYSNDDFLVSTLNSILKDLLRINGNESYEEINTISNKTLNSIPKTSGNTDFLYKESVLNTKKVQTHQKELNLFNLPIKSSNKKMNYTFKNSSLLKHFEYLNPILTVTYKNDRKYTYSSVPCDKADMCIKLDELNQSPGKYFCKEIRNTYQYVEVTGSEERVG